MSLSVAARLVRGELLPRRGRVPRVELDRLEEVHRRAGLEVRATVDEFSKAERRVAQLEAARLRWDRERAELEARLAELEDHQAQLEARLAELEGAR